MRALTPTIVTELSKGGVRWALLFEAEWSGANGLYLWTGLGEIQANGKLYLGNGWLNAVNPVSETTEIRSEGLSVLLTGVPLDLISLTLARGSHSKTGTLWLVFLDSVGNVLPDPFKLFYGYFDNAVIERRPTDADLTLNYESRLADLDRAREHRYTNQDQQTIYPGDRGFEYVLSLQEWNGFWGRPEAGITVRRRGRR